MKLKLTVAVEQDPDNDHTNFIIVDFDTALDQTDHFVGDGNTEEDYADDLGFATDMMRQQLENALPHIFKQVCLSHRPDYWRHKAVEIHLGDVLEDLATDCNPYRRILDVTEYGKALRAEMSRFGITNIRRLDADTTVYRYPDWTQVPVFDWDEHWCPECNCYAKQCQFGGIHPGTLPVKPQPNYLARYDGYNDVERTHYLERLDKNGSPTEDYRPFKCPYPNSIHYTIEHDGEQWVWVYHLQPQHATRDYED